MPTLTRSLSWAATASVRRIDPDAACICKRTQLPRVVSLVLTVLNRAAQLPCALLSDPFPQRLMALTQAAAAVAVAVADHDESAYSITALRDKDFGQIVYSPQVEWDGVTVAVDGELRVTGTPSMTPLVRLVTATTALTAPRPLTA